MLEPVRGSRSRLVPCIGWALALGMTLGTLGCEPNEPSEPATWQIVQEGVSGALLSVWGTSASDVWVVGADARDGLGPTVLHFDGVTWERVSTGQTQGDLWWVFGFDGGPIYMGGDGGVILRHQPGDGTFTRMDTPGVQTVFGIWGSSPDDVWAVGGESESTGGFAWRLAGDAWVPEPSVPADVTSGAAIWKIYGTSPSDAWAVGSNGVALHWDGTAFSPGDTGVGSSLFTVHELEGRYAAVGGLASGIIVEREGDAWRNVTPDPAPMGLSGVTLGPGGTGVAVGFFGAVYVRDDADGWQPGELGDASTRENLHGTFIDDEGGYWLAGGQTLSPPYSDGILLHYGALVPTGGS